MDIRKLVSKSKHELSSGLFEIFGNYSDEPPDTVHDNLLGWIYDNFHNIENWFSIALKQKGVSRSDWAESMCDPKHPGDELCLYLLCRMYRKHALVHLKHHWLSTIQHTLPGDLDDILSKCYMEFVFVREWVFGEVKVIRKPISACAASPKPLGIMDSVITENVIASKELLMKSYEVRIERLPVPTPVSTNATPDNSNSYNMHIRPPKNM